MKVDIIDANNNNKIIENSSNNKKEPVKMGKRIIRDLVGNVYGELTVISKANDKIDSYGWRHSNWNCQCPEGHITEVLEADLIREVGGTRKCKICKQNFRESMPGRVFGMLTIIERDPVDYKCMCNGKPKYEAKWICECSCENHTKVSVIQHNLLNGHTWNCGCSNSNRKNTEEDMIGKKFGHLTVISAADPYIIPTTGEKEIQWNCQCDCENHTIIIVRGKSLRTGHTVSCGCHIQSITHGGSKSRLYGVWIGMKRRCFNENDDAYYNYGARGITICDEWLDFANFRDWALKSGYDENAKYGECTIDRIDNNGNYEPNNCRWTDLAGQSNNRRNNVIIKYKDESKTATQWAREINIDPATLLKRVSLGWTPEQIIEIPVNYYIHKVFAFGQEHTLKEWSILTGLNSNLLYDRIFRQNWDSTKSLLIDPSTNNNLKPAVMYNENGYNISERDYNIIHSNETLKMF